MPRVPTIRNVLAALVDLLGDTEKRSERAEWRFGKRLSKEISNVHMRWYIAHANEALGDVLTRPKFADFSTEIFLL